MIVTSITPLADNIKIPCINYNHHYVLSTIPFIKGEICFATYVAFLTFRLIPRTAFTIHNATINLYFSQRYKSLDNLLSDHKLRVTDINGLLTTITVLIESAHWLK
jgi:hypothetical protein